jgi:tRNA-splicing ligase RtcB
MLEALQRVGPNRYRLETAGAPVEVFANPALLEGLEPVVFQQARNVAALPGVERVVLMPDAHSGYGAPIGSVVSTTDTIIPMVAGFDISCGMSFLATDLDPARLGDRRERRRFMEAVELRVALGKRPAHQPVDAARFQTLVRDGARSYPQEVRDRLERVAMETTGNVSARAGTRGRATLGSVGSGNHFLEFQEVKVAPAELDTAARFGIRAGVGVMLHTGSRGMGHQVATEFLNELQSDFRQRGIPLVDRELVHMPAASEVGRRYLDAMGAAANVAILNRLLLVEQVQDALEEAFRVGSHLVYDVSHNLIQREPLAAGERWIHRKGATRAFPAGHPALPELWQALGHPVITPGSMGTESHIQVALPGAEESLFSINHGAGRVMGRRDARRRLDQAAVDRSLDEQDILVNARHVPLDEAPEAYKDIREVIDTIAGAGLARVVATCRPLMVLKGHD